MNSQLYQIPNVYVIFIPNKNIFCLFILNDIITATSNIFGVHYIDSSHRKYGCYYVS